MPNDYVNSRTSILCADLNSSVAAHFFFTPSIQGVNDLEKPCNSESVIIGNILVPINVYLQIPQT